jgi:hypothetical protein
MKEDKSTSSLFDGATSHVDRRSGIWTNAARFLLVALLMMYACTRDRSPQKASTELPRAEHQPEQTTTPSPPQPRELPEPSATATQSLEGSGKMAWAKGFAGQLIAGLDGELYEPYRTVTIERIQRLIRERGLYTGPINGILDTPTMKAIYAFQEATHILQVCGVPTPRTRKMLEQGSHTDLSS